MAKPSIIYFLVASVSTYTLSRSSPISPQRSCAALRATGGASAEATTAAALIGDANAGLFDADTIKVLDSLAALGQGHLFADWPAAGQDDAGKRSWARRSRRRTTRTPAGYHRTSRRPAPYWRPRAAATTRSAASSPRSPTVKP